jgi:hypothetical protein
MPMLALPLAVGPFLADDKVLVNIWSTYCSCRDDDDSRPCISAMFLSSL